MSQKTLEAELTFVQGIVEKKNTIPVLSNVLIEATGEQSVKITATDLDTTIIAHAAANVTDAGEMCVSAKKLYDIIKLLPRTDVFFATEAASFSVKIAAGKSNFKIAGVGRESFPETIKNGGIKTTLPGDVLRAFIKHTNFCMSGEQSRYTLNGAKFELHGRTARMVTTDGHRLAHIETTLDAQAAASADVLIPRKALTELVKLIGDANADIAFWEDSNHLYFETGARLLVTRKFSGMFPNYEMVIPKDNTEIATFEAAALLAAIMRVSQMADERTRSINLMLRANEMVISAQCAEEGAAHESLAVEYSGEETTLKFQHDYIRDFINSVKDDPATKISMSFKDMNAPTLFRPATENGKRYLGVIMPLRH